MLNLAWVRTFVTLAQQRSFQAAAEQLKISQPTVSQHIQKLEEQLGVLLVHRARMGCAPTREAMAFLAYAQSLLCLNDRALAAVKGEHLRIGAGSNIGIYLLTPYVQSFLETWDRGAFDLVIDRNPTIAERLEIGELDVAVMEWWAPRPGFEARLWRSEPVVVIVPPAHPLASCAQLSRKDLAGLEFLGGEPGTGTGRLLDRYLGAGAALPQVSLQLGSTEAVKRAVMTGLGISLVLAAAVVDEVQNGSLCAIPLLDPPLRKDLFVIWRDREVRHLPPPAFVRHLLADSPSQKR